MKIAGVISPVLSVCCVLSACAATRPRAECELHGGRKWRQVRTDHFIVYTDADKETAFDAARTLEWTRRALLVMWDDRFDPPTLVDVILLRHRGEWEEFGDVSFGGMMVLLIPRPLIVLVGRLAMGDLGPERRVVAHELTHYLSSFIFLDKPRWFDEGLAKFMETVQEGLEEREVVLGQPDLGALEYVQLRAPLHIEEMWRWNTYRVSDEDLSYYYASSWAWFHYLYYRHQDPFSRFWDGLLSGDHPRQVWNQAFAGIDDDALYQGLIQYLNGGQYEEIIYTLDSKPVKIDERALTPSQVHVLRAKLFAFGLSRESTKESAYKILSEIRMAISLDESNVEARALMIGTLDDPKHQLKLAEKLVEDYPNNIESLKALISTLRRNKETKQLEETLVRALTIAPRDPLVLKELALLRASAGNMTEALVFIERAFKLAPWDAWILGTYAAIKAQIGACEEALILKNQALLALPEGTPRKIHVELEQFLLRFCESCLHDKKN